jgi:hypothetical protein
MRPVHRVAGVKGDNSPPAKARKLGPELGGSQAESAKVVVARKLNPLQRSADVVRVGDIEKVSHARVLSVRCAEDGLGFGQPVRLPDVLDVQPG